MDEPVRIFHCTTIYVPQQHHILFHGRKHFVLHRNIYRDNRGAGACLLEDAIIVTRMGIPPAGRDCALGPDGKRSARSGEICRPSAARHYRPGERR
ncbi:hypothetical protein MPLA_1350005 [Mesorhizobium sp. ORS 3359]|nr:hypothetical protein MPLA_1350005 [Mesorhizobium sp. ORS 3359]